MAAKCKVCQKSVYPMDPQINLDGSIYHKPCAKCADCNCQITISNFTKNEAPGQTVLLCKTHYFKRFHEGGQYLGADKYKVQAERDLHAQERRQSYGTLAPPAVNATLSTESADGTPALEDK